MRFIDSIAPLPRGQKDTLLSHWAECSALLRRVTGPQLQFVINLEAECRLCQDAWQEIHGVMMSGIRETAQLQQAFTTVFRNYLLKGDLVVLPPPAPLGRAVTKDSYIELLRDQFGFSSEDELEQFLDDLLGGAATTASNCRRLRNRLLAQQGRIMWATVDLLPDSVPSGQNPFANMPRDANSIRAQLGLISSKEEKRKDLLLFVYNLPAGLMAYFPTIAEAYAGEDWLWYFRPATAIDTYGRTMPWPDTKHPPSPEVVHEPITGNNLVEKITVARVRGRR